MSTHDKAIALIAICLWLAFAAFCAGAIIAAFEVATTLGLFAMFLSAACLIAVGFFPANRKRPPAGP